MSLLSHYGVQFCTVFKTSACLVTLFAFLIMCGSADYTVSGSRSRSSSLLGSGPRGHAEAKMGVSV